MLKKFKTMLAFVLVLAFIVCPLVKADNEEASATTTENVEAQVTETTTSEETEAGNKDEEIKENDVYLYGDDITVDYAVDGNAFIFGNTVNIKNKISGDLFVFANKINIDGGYVYSNVFACGNELKISGVIYDLYAVCSKIEIAENGYVYRDAHSISDNLNLYGTVGRNALVGANNMSFQKDENEKKVIGKIYGNLTYSAEEEMEIPESMVEGNVKFAKFDTEKSKDITTANIIYKIITAIVYTVLIYLVLVWLAPNFVSKLEETLTKNVGSVIGFGILTILALPIISFVLLLTGIVFSFGFLLATLYGVLLAIASSITIITVSNIVSNKFNINNKFAKIGVVAGISLVYGLLKLIPIISGLAIIACGWLGTGIVVKQILPSKEKAE